MARKKISELESATDVTASDLIQIVDVEDSGMAVTGTNKKATASLLAKELAKQPLEPGVVISGSTSSDAVRITQTGSGNALVVEDSANPDSSAFVITSSGIAVAGDTASRTIAGITTSLLQVSSINNAGYSSGLSAIAWDDDTTGDLLAAPVLSMSRSASSTTGTNSSVVSNNALGSITFQGADGTSFIRAANIAAYVDGTPGTNDMPGRLVFSTTADGASVSTERMRITSAGNVGIGTTAPDASCLLELSSTSSGFRPPSMTTAQRNLIATPVAGVVIYNNSTNKLNFYNGSAWEAVTSAV